jgi:hypothetical protein
MRSPLPALALAASTLLPTASANFDVQPPAVDGKVYGNCIVFPHGDFDCLLEAGSSSSFVGWRKFRCLTEGIQPSE